MQHPVAVIVAFLALGSNLAGVLLLLLLNPGSRSVRWYLPFMIGVCAWLLSQGASLIWPSNATNTALAWTVTALPLLFFAFAMMECAKWPGWMGVLGLLLMSLLIPFVSRSVYHAEGSNPLIGSIWMYGGWLGGSARLWWTNRTGQSERSGGVAEKQLRARLVLLAFLLIAPVSVVTALFVKGYTFILYGMPFITMAVMFLTFYGITRLQFYNIEVRVRRTGEIAAETVETERLAVLGELAATIAHEVRNPLTGVRSLAQRIAEDDIDDDKRRRYASVILEETGRVERLVSNLLEVSRRGVRTPAPLATSTPLAPVFEDVTLLIASRAQRKGVTINTQPTTLNANASREALAQTLLNLLLNAVSHAPPGSAIDLSAQQGEGGHVSLVVSDRGPGVPTDMRERIFDPFYSTDAQGTGLGLSVVRHMAREHGWTVRVDDTPGGGATFTVTI